MAKIVLCHCFHVMIGTTAMTKQAHPTPKARLSSFKQTFFHNPQNALCFFQSDVHFYKPLS